MVDRNGLPLAILNTAANTADCKMFVETIDAIPFGRRPVQVHADKGYESQAFVMPFKSAAFWIALLAAVWTAAKSWAATAGW